MMYYFCTAQCLVFRGAVLDYTLVDTLDGILQGSCSLGWAFGRNPNWRGGKEAGLATGGNRIVQKHSLVQKWS